MARNRRTRRNKSEGGKRKARRNNTVGGRRKTRKLSKGASTWQKSVMKVYREMKAANPNTKLGDAMRRAAELKRKGQL